MGDDSASFTGGNLEEFSANNQVRLLCTSEIRELSFATPCPPSRLMLCSRCFGGGATDEDVLSDVLSSAESKSEWMMMARRVLPP